MFGKESAKGGESFGVLLTLHAGEGEVKEDALIGGADGEGAAVGGDSLIEAIGSGVDEPEILERSDVVGRGFEDLLEGEFGGGVVAVGESGDGAGKDFREGVGGEGESGGEENDCAHASMMIRGWGKRL